MAPHPNRLALPSPLPSPFPTPPLPILLQWSFNPSTGHFTVAATGACLRSRRGSGQFMVNEFGDGALTFYGNWVTDYCVAAC